MWDITCRGVHRRNSPRMKNRPHQFGPYALVRGMGEERKRASRKESKCLVSGPHCDRGGCRQRRLIYKTLWNHKGYVIATLYILLFCLIFFCTLYLYVLILFCTLIVWPCRSSQFYGIWQPPPGRTWSHSANPKFWRFCPTPSCVTSPPGAWALCRPRRVGCTNAGTFCPWAVSPVCCSASDVAHLMRIPCY